MWPWRVMRLRPGGLLRKKQSFYKTLLNRARNDASSSLSVMLAMQKPPGVPVPEWVEPPGQKTVPDKSGSKQWR